MKKKPVTTAPQELGHLIAEVRGLIQSARHAAATAVNTLQVLTNFEIGRRIVEHEQQGAERAGYGKELIKTLSARLIVEFGRGFSEDNLARMRNFYIAWKDSVSEFPRHRRGNSPPDKIAQKPYGDLIISATPSRESPFSLSWSHYVLLLTIKDSNERRFYGIEATSSTTVCCVAT